MSITPLPDANFSPTLSGYTGQGTFKFWCQKVLPLIYDDSLSYYELLCKFVNFLNNVIQDIDSVEENVNGLATAFNQLQDYVNEYFNGLDVQAEINNKLDEMAEDGTLSEIIFPIAEQAALQHTQDYLAENLGRVVGTQLPNVVADQIDHVVATQIDSVVSEQIDDPVAEWLDENITPTTPVIDATLRVTGAAADARETGKGVFGADHTAYFLSRYADREPSSGSINYSTGTVDSTGSGYIYDVNEDEIIYYAEIHPYYRMTESGCKISIFAYDGNNNYIGCYNGLSFVKSEQYSTTGYFGVAKQRHLSDGTTYIFHYKVWCRCDSGAADAMIRCRLDNCLVEKGIPADGYSTGLKIDGDIKSAGAMQINKTISFTNGYIGYRDGLTAPQIQGSVYSALFSGSFCNAIILKNGYVGNLLKYSANNISTANYIGVWDGYSWVKSYVSPVNTFTEFGTGYFVLVVFPYNGEAFNAENVKFCDGTDTTLSVSGVAADAKAVGDAINAIPVVHVDNTLSVSNDAADAKVTGDNFTDLNNFCKKTVVGETSGSINVTQGTGVYAINFITYVSIPSGEEYDIVLHANGHIVNKYHLYANDSPIKYNCEPETSYHLTAGSDIANFSIVASAADVVSSGAISLVVTSTVNNPNSLEAKIENLEQEQNELNYLIDGEVLEFYEQYEVGKTVNNSGNATYIYHNFITPIDGTKMYGLLCSSVENVSVDKPFQFYQLDAQDNTLKQEFFSAEDGKRGIKISPVENATKIRLALYASSSGGLVDQTAKYNELVIFLSDSGSYTIKENCVPDKYSVPFYYLKNNYLQDKVNTIEGIMRSAGGDYDAFIFCTDQHWPLNAKQSPKLINYICNRLKIKKMFMGGDYSDGINLNAYYAFRECFDGNVYDVVGNHEYMNYFFDIGKGYVSKNINDGDIWAYLNMKMTNASEVNFSRNYYFVDDTMRKMRYIVLNVYADNGNSATSQFENEQKTWLQNTALNLPSGYTAIIFAHYLYSVNYDTGVITAGSTTSDIVSIVDGYSGNGTIACLVAGHTHVDGMTVTGGGVPVFITTCDKYLPWISGGVDQEPWLAENRHLGTTTEQAFDVCIVDKKNKLISFVRIGAPADNGTNEKLELRQQNYS